MVREETWEFGGEFQVKRMFLIKTFFIDTKAAGEESDLIAFHIQYQLQQKAVSFLFSRELRRVSPCLILGGLR